MRRIARKILTYFRPTSQTAVNHSNESGQSRRSVDDTPWDHPWLTRANLTRLKQYSTQVWDFALEHHSKSAQPFSIAFTVNMAQSMYKWALVAQEANVPSALYCHPLDTSALSLPQWEEFDGEFSNLQDGRSFLQRHPSIHVKVPLYTFPVDNHLDLAHKQFLEGDREPLHRLLAENPTLRHEAFVAYPGVASYFNWIGAIARHDVIYTTSAIPGYLSGRPYLAFSPGGDLQFDCGRSDWLGKLTGLAYNAARFITFTNPDKLAHLRRFGFSNGLYVPYVMDDHRYCPGTGTARRVWEERYGPGVYVLATARIDNAVKGNGESLFNDIRQVAKSRPSVRFVFLSWGHNAEQFQKKVKESGLSEQIIFQAPVGKKRLIDYYRSCDFVLDQFVFGYYGATGQEAAAVGKPILMRIREDHYGPLYGGDIAPVDNANPDEVRDALLKLIDDKSYRIEKGRLMREWLVRNHGAKRWGPVMLALLCLAANQIPLPPDLNTPLRDALTEEERQYHKDCLRAAA